MTTIDIVVIGLLVALVASRFFAYKLPKDTRSKDLRRTDFSKLFQRHIPADPKTDEAKIGNVSVRTPPVAAPAKLKEKASPAVKRVSAKELAAMNGLEKIKALDPQFDEKKFLEGAKTAYMYFYTCWNAKDEQGLAELCAPRLVDRVASDWERKWYKINVENVSAVELGEARVTGRTAIVEAVIHSMLKVGMVRKRVKSTWVLARAIGSDDPNWELQETQEAHV